MNFVDFDGIRYRLSTDSRDNVENGKRLKVILSISLNCFEELKVYGVQSLITGIYTGDCEVLSVPEEGFDISIAIDLEGKTPGEKEGLFQRLSMLKRNCLAGPFYEAFDCQSQGKPSALMTIPYRDNEAIYVRAHADRVTVIFSTVFRDPSDVVYGRVFLKVFNQPCLQFNVLTSLGVCGCQEEVVPSKGSPSTLFQGTTDGTPGYCRD